MDDPRFTFEAVLEWAKTQDPKKKYDFCSLTTCACAQYAGTLNLPLVFPRWEESNTHNRPFLRASKIAGEKWYELNKVAGECKNFGEFAEALQKAIEARTEALSKSGTQIPESA